MAAEIPVKDVLCEAMEYLSKLGSNLRSRSDNLKEKKIRRDKLTNALAVQKAADKVLLICELSKKSLANVEAGIRKVLEHIDVSQTSSSVGGKSSSSKFDDRDHKRDKPKYHYFDYKSRKLKIKNKISLKHYKSVKVLVKKMTKSIMDKYPVHHDCKLYRMRRRESKNKQLVQNNSESDTSGTNVFRRRSSDKTLRKIRNRIEDSDDQDDTENHKIKPDINKGSDNEKKDEPNVDGEAEHESDVTNKIVENTSSTTQLVQNNSETNTSVTNKARRRSSDKIQRKIRNRIEDSDDQDDTEDYKKKSIDKNESSDNQQEKRPSVDGCSENESNNTSSKVISYEPQTGKSCDEPEPKKRKISINDREQLNVNTDDSVLLDSDNINSNPSSSKNDKNDTDTDSKIPLIKCVSLSKLLKPNVLQKDPAMTSVPKSGKKKLNNKLEFDVAKKNEMLQTAKKNKDEFWAQKRKEVSAFKPKMFVINIIRLPSLDTDYLIENRLKKITKEGKTICEIAEDISDSLSKNIHKSKSKQTSDTPVLSDDPDDEQLLAEAIKVKNSLLNESDSDNGLDTIEKEAETTVDKIKNALLNSDSDQNGNASDTNSNKKHETEKSKDTQNQLNSDNNENSQTKISKKKSESDKTKTVLDSETAKNDLLDKSDSENKSEKSDKSNKEENKENSENENDFVGWESQEKQKTPEKELAASNDDNAKKSLLNDSSDDATEIPLDQRKVTTPQSKKKRIRESVQAKNALLRYSSGSETEDEKLKNTLNDIKKSLLECMSDDENKLKVKNLDKQNKSTTEKSSSSEEDIVHKKKESSKKVKKKRPKVKKRCIKSDGSEEGENDSSDDDHKSTSNNEKMVRSKAKPGNSSSHSSDAQDSIEKDIDGLTNLRTLNKVRRRNSDATEESESSKSMTSRSRMAAKPTDLISEDILQAESSSDAASNDEDDGVDEDLPPVTLPGFNGGLEHLVKEDLLRESDSSMSNKEEEIKEESDEERLNARRRKANAIASSDSETSTVRKKVKDDSVRMSDFEDSDDSDINKRSKRKKKGSESDGSAGSSDTGKKKRRRIKPVNDSDVSGSDSENEGKNKHGRKKIRKVMGKNQLEEATKKAAREEKERVARIAERQKMYNNFQFDESGKPDEVVLDKVVLDFDPETKEPLIAVDCGLVKKLKPHQANGIKFMWDACFESVNRIKKDKGSGCILAHCMGLGKTLQVVALTHTLIAHDSLTKVHRVLVVCPLSTVLNWVNEFKMWLKYELRESDIDVYELSRFKQNSERAFQLSQWFEHGGVCVLGYEMFRNLSADNNKKFKKKMLKNFQEALVDPGPDLVVCDEGHLLKNEKTSLSQSMNKVRTLRRIVLTGTPLQNNLKEYYCMVQFVKPNLLGKYNEYLNRFVNPITNGQYTDSTEHDIKIMKRRSHVLHKMLDGAVQRRDYGVLAPFLPPKHEYVLFITLTEVQAKLYQFYLDNYSRRPLPGKSSGFLFKDFQSLQRIWTHPLVLKYNSDRYEIMQQKKRDKEEEDSEGSLVDFIDDDSTPDESSSSDSTDDSSELSDDSRKKKKSSKKNKGKDKDKDNESAAPSRGTRANPIDLDLEDDKGDDVLEVKHENPADWWIKMVEEDVLEDLRNSHKLVLLFDILRQCETIGDKLLVFSQSLYSLDLIEHFLGKVDEATQDGRIDEKLGNHVGSWSPGIDYFRLDGSTSCENRSIWCKNFNREDNPRARLFLISTRAGGLGINLVAANRVVIFDVSWNPSHDVQSIFRVYRFGQKKPCYVYRFLAMGTMEEKIYERQVTKQAISKRVIDEQQIDRHYAENDLAELYKFEAEPPTPRPIPPLPKDRLFAEMLREHEAKIYKYHEHDSLLENKEEETLSEEERKAAWEDFENEKNRPPPAPFPSPWPMHNGMVPNLLAQQQQQLAYAALAAMLRKDMPNVNDNQIRDMLPMIYNANPALMQKMSQIYKYPQQMNMTPAMMAQANMNPVNSGGGGMAGMGGASGQQYEPSWQRQQQQQQQMRLQQLMAQQPRAPPAPSQDVVNLDSD